MAASILKPGASVSAAQRVLRGSSAILTFVVRPASPIVAAVVVQGGCQRRQSREKETVATRTVRSRKFSTATARRSVSGHSRAVRARNASSSASARLRTIFGAPRMEPLHAFSAAAGSLCSLVRSRRRRGVEVRCTRSVIGGRPLARALLLACSLRPLADPRAVVHLRLRLRKPRICQDGQVRPVDGDALR